MWEQSLKKEVEEVKVVEEEDAEEGDDGIA